MKEEIGNNKGEIIIYQSEDGKKRLDVRLEEKMVWLTQEQIAQLYGNWNDKGWRKTYVVSCK